MNRYKKNARRWGPAGLLIWSLGVGLPGVQAQGTLQVECSKGITEAECGLVQVVGARLLTVADPVPGYAWPPHVVVKALGPAVRSAHWGEDGRVEKTVPPSHLPVPEAMISLVAGTLAGKETLGLEGTAAAGDLGTALARRNLSAAGPATGKLLAGEGEVKARIRLRSLLP